MNKMIKTVLSAGIALIAFSTVMANDNVFYKNFEGPHSTAPFSKIDNSQWVPAIDRGIELAQQEIKAITDNKEAPTFQNTIVALERSGKDLDRVLNIFYPLLSANADNEMLAISLETSGKLSEYSTSIILNEELWKRVKSVYENNESWKGLTPEDSMLLQKTYDSFALSGANLEGADREKYGKLMSELSEQTTIFGQNVLKDVANYELVLEASDLDGLPETAIIAAAESAKEKGYEGKYRFGLDQPTYMQFMKYSKRRDLREKMYRLYSGRNMSGDYNNLPVLKKIAELRLEMANLLGSKNYASQSLKKTMAGNPEEVYKLLNSLKEAYAPVAVQELQELSDFASELEGQPVKIMPWDYSYYSNKLKEAKYSFDEEALRPYFELNNTINGVFGLATILYGLHFTENPTIEVYHPDVKAFDVTDDSGNFVGVIYTDFFPRESKRPGAWMTGFKDQYITADGENSRPQVSIVMNFTKPTGDKPSLLTPYEVETFLHEFGHALHGLLANTNYASMSGTSVYRDFVELPSQFNENYLTQKEFLDGFARHYETGEPIPQELVDRLIRSSQYGAAYACMRQLGFGFLDMAFHTIENPIDDPKEFELKAIEEVQLFEPVEGTLIAPQFSHIFSGGYAAGYYSYKWAEVLDADAFAMFLENGIFDRETADSFKNNILTRGGTEDPSILYRRFRGQDPSIEALLIRDGIKKPNETKIQLPELKH